MSIQTEIDRIAAAKEAIVAALTEKGVSVGGGSKLEDLSEAVKKVGSLVGATIDKIILTQTYSTGTQALSFIQSVVDSSAALCIFYDEGTHSCNYESSYFKTYDFTFCCYYPQVVTASEKWKALRWKNDGTMGNNAGTSMPSLHGGHTLIRITFPNERS